MSDLGLVVYVCADPGIPVFGTKGSSIHVRAVLAELARRAAEVHLVTLRRGGEPGPELAGVEIHELAAPGGDDAVREAALVAIDGHIADRVAQIVGDRRPDVVYQRYSLWSCETMELAKRRGWPSVLEINAPLVDEQGRHRRLVDRATAEARTARAIGAARLPIAVTADVARWAERLGGRDTAVVSNGVDTARFAHVERAPRPTGDERLTLGFVGTYKPWHDLAAIVTAVERLSSVAAAPPIRLLLVGDGPELPRLLARLDALGAGIEVDAVGAVPADRIPALLGEIDVALAPYGPDEQYFSPLKVFEYLAAGIAVVASGISGLDGSLRDGEALLVAPGDRDGFAHAVERLCTDPALRRTLGAAGRKAALARFGWDRVVDGILAALQPAMPLRTGARR